MRHRLYSRALAITAGLTGAVGLAGSARAQLVFNLNVEFSGGQAPSGAAPWMTATFADNGTNNVRLTIKDNFTGSGNVLGFYFNITPSVSDPASLGWGLANFNSSLSSAGVAPLNFQASTANPSSDTTFKADGDGFFNFLISWKSGQSPMSASTTAVFDFSAPGLTASSFNQSSAPGGGNGSYHTAAHVQNTTGAGNGGSGWIGDTSVPGPGGLSILFAASALATGRRRPGR